MLTVSTVNFDPADGTADVRHGPMELGEMPPGALAGLLGKLQTVDPAQNHEHEPCVVVKTDVEKFLIRNSGGRLVLYDARDTTQPGAPLDIAGIVRAVGAGFPPAGIGEKEEVVVDDSAGMSAGRLSLRAVLTVVLLILGLGLNGWAIYGFLHGDGKPATPQYAPVTDAAELDRVRKRLAGTYITGVEAGDRAIVITPQLAVIFREFGPVVEKTPTVRFEQSDAGVIGRRDGVFCLATERSGLIKVQDDNSLLYYGDSYRRLQNLAE